VSVAAELERDAVEAFTDSVRFATVEEFTVQWSTKAELDDLKHFIGVKISEERANQLRLFSDQIKVRPT